MLSILGIIVLIVVLLFLLLPLVIKKDYVVEKQVTVNRSNDAVFDYIKLLDNQRHYNKWVMMDPQVKRSSRGMDGTKGFVTSWDSQVKSVGKGEQEITYVAPGSAVDSIVRFEKPFKNVADVRMSTKSSTSGQTIVIWRMNGQNKYPMNIMNLFIPGMLGKDMSESLSNLKNVLEK